MKNSLLLLCLVICVAACGGKKDKGLGDVSDMCQLIDETLIGTFAVGYQEGIWVFSGGLNGSVDISGKDYNDITCNYIISDCSNNKISMNCNGAPYETDLVVYNRDSIKVGVTTYTRVK